MIIKSIKDGNWSDKTTWSPARVPKDGDTVEIGHRVVCEPEMKPIKGAQIRMITPDAVLDTRHIKFSGLRPGSGIAPTTGD